MTLEAIDFDLNGVVAESLRIFEIAIRDKHLRLELDYEIKHSGRLRGDPVRIRQVLINLIGNAVKFTSAGTVRLAVTSPRSGNILFVVTDTGIGIAPEKLGTIFDAFMQADGSHTRRFGGTGLGLAITRRLVGLLGGRLWAESELGVGSRFYCELPLELGAEVPVSSPEPFEYLPIQELDVLVAEDNPVNQRVICAMLRRQGWNVTLANTGREAYHSFLAGRFDLVLMDIQMPDMDGLQAAGLIRREEQRRAGTGLLHRTPIIALTAHASKSQHDQCLAERMDGVITKPVTLKALLYQISKVLADRS